MAKTHHFVPIAVETGGALNELALEFITKLGRRIARITQEPFETQFLFQRLSISLQRGDAVAFRNTFSSEHPFLHHWRAIPTSNELIYNFQAYRLCAGRRKKMIIIIIIIITLPSTLFEMAASSIEVSLLRESLRG